MTKAEYSEAFSEVERKHDDSVTSLDYAHIHESIIIWCNPISG